MNVVFQRQLVKSVAKRAFSQNEAFSNVPPHIYPMPWTFWKAPGKPQVPQRYLDLTKNVSDAEISRSAQLLWSQTIKLAKSDKLKDPWARLMAEHDALMGNKWEKIKRMFPGLSLGVGAFTVYYIYQQLIAAST